MTSNALAAAREMQPLIRAHRDETEENRRLAAPIVARLVETRLCRMALGIELGGLATPGVEALRVYETLAEAEASVPWIVWNASLVGYFSRYMAKPRRKDVFGDPTWLYAQSHQPSGSAEIEGDAYRLSGRWSLVSGCELADWILLAGIVTANGTPRTSPTGDPEMRFFFVRRTDCEILDTWHVGGLRGTGSHDVVSSGVSVPAERSFSLSDPIEPIAHPVERVAIIPSLCAGFAAQTLGVARLCLDTLVELARTKVTPAPVPDLRDRPNAQAAVPMHEAALAAARTHLHGTVDDLWSAAVDGRDATLDELGRAYGASLHAIEVSRTVVDSCHALGGTSALYMSCPIERAHRDLHAMLRHVVASPTYVEDAGRVRFGLEPLGPIYRI